MKKIVIYDFDGTITPYPITVLGILEKCGFVGGGNNLDFKRLVSEKMSEKNISVYNSFYETIFEIVESKGYLLKDDVLSIGAKRLEYNNGVVEFLEYLYSKGIDNYIISSGLKCFLKKTVISKYIKEIYATTFKYKNGIVYDIENIVTDVKKIECVKDIIIKNKLEDCSNIVYIGDGLTDLPIMEYVKNNGGTTIYVSDQKLEDIDNNTVSYYFNKDYSLNADIFNVICELFDI